MTTTNPPAPPTLAERAEARAKELNAMRSGLSRDDTAALLRELVEENRRLAADSDRLSTALKIAFAEMWLAWSLVDYWDKNELGYIRAAERMQAGERTHDLLAEMKRVTGELRNH